jgi:hypothetical protein
MVEETQAETAFRVFEKLFPQDVTVTPEARHPNAGVREVYLGGAHRENTMVSYVKQGVNCPLSEMSFVIGVQGRGTLNIPGSELMSLWAVGNALIKELAGLNDPVQIDVSETNEA